MFERMKRKLLIGMTVAMSVLFGAGVYTQALTAEQFPIEAWAESYAPTPDGVEDSSSADSNETESGTEKTVEIVSKNLSYSDALYILYAVDYAGFDESASEIKMLFWSEPQTEYTVETAESESRANHTATVRGEECLIFYTGGISAREMNDNVYCRAYARVDGEAVYSDVEKYSVVDYVYEKRAEGNLTNEQTAVFADMLNYGSSAQMLFGYNTDELANATYYTVTVEGGTLEDGLTWGRYASNATATLTASPSMGEEPFARWKDHMGVTVGTETTLAVTVTADSAYTAIYVSETPASAFRYTTDGASVEIYDYVGEYTDVVIPSEINGLPVTSIGGWSFDYCDALTSVVIPDSVLSIGDHAFYGCDALKRVSIGNGVTSIGVSAFSHCSALTSVVLGNSVTSIGDYAFNGCSALTDISIPDSVTSIGYSAFSHCSALTSVVLGNSVTSIGNYAFNGCSALTDISVPDSVTSIGSYAFSNCIGLISLVIPAKVTTIENGAFWGCSNLIEVVNRSSFITVEKGSRENGYVGYYALAVYNSGDTFTGTGVTVDDGYVVYTDGEDRILAGYFGEETDLILPAYITKINQSAFDENYAITSVVIPEGVTEIGSSAFNHCYHLAEVVNRSPFLTVTKGSWGNGDIGYYALAVYNSGDTFTGTKLLRDNGYVVYADGDERILVTYEGSAVDLVLPSYITSVREYTFYGLPSVESVVLSDAMTSLPEDAFYNCDALKDVTLSAGITHVAPSAFTICSKLTNISVDENNAHYQSIDGNLYTKDGKTLVQYAIGKTDTEFTVPTGVEAIADCAFAYCYVLTSVTLPSTLKTIGAQAFYSCGELTSVVIPDGVTSIGSEAFSWCNHLTSVVIPASVTTVGEEAFAYSSNLTITCKLTSAPSGWDEDWNYSNCPVIWEGADGTSMAKAYTARATQVVTIDTAGEKVYYKYVATTSGSVTFKSTMSGSTLQDTYGYLYDANGNQITSNDDGGDNMQFSITYTVTAGQTYYIVVRLYSSSKTGSFNLVIS